MTSNWILIDVELIHIYSFDEINFTYKITYFDISGL